MVIRVKSVEPFEYHCDGTEAVLLIHGFTGSPTEMAPLGKYLHQKGYSVYCPLLKGHGTTVEDMEKSNWKDWVGSAEAALKELQSRYEKVYVVGFSMGGCIALYLTMNHKVNGVVSISAPIYITDRLAPYTPFLKYFKRYKPKNKKVQYDVPIFSYDSTPIGCVPSLLKLIKYVKNNLHKIKAPALVIQGDEDQVVRPESAIFIYENIQSEKKVFKEFPNRSHMIVVEKGRQEILAEVEDFLWSLRKC